jgi:transposase
MKLLIGIDWSKDQHNVCIMNEVGAQMARFDISHSPAGFAELAAKIDRFNVPACDCLVALETAHNLLLDFLWSRGYAVYVIAPSVVKSSRGRFGSSSAHNDESDALLLADMLRTDRARFAPWKPDGALVT